MSHADRQKGFTLIELLLAMTFLSMLLLAIALTIVQISAIYNRGITVKEVTQAATSLATDLQDSIAASTPFSINGTSTQYIQQGNWGGRLCLGEYSYIWNYGTAINNNQTGSLNVYATGDNAPTTPIGLVRAYDPDGSYCTTSSKPIDPSTAVELVDVGQHSLAIHDLTISSGSTASDPTTGEQLYTVNFTIGTNDAGTLSTDSNGYVDGCLPPGTPGADPTYCVVQQFSIVARAGNTVD